MASRPYFDKHKGHWYMKWKSIYGWQAARLCPHPNWTRGDEPPRRPPPDAVRLARTWEDRELAARSGVEGASSRPAPLAGFLEGYLMTAGAGLTPGSLAIVSRNVGRFAAWCKARKITAVPQVTPDVCRRYLAERAPAVKHSTLKSERASLSPAWSQAFQDGRVKENPWLRAPVRGKPRTERPPYWTTEEVERLAAVCKPWLADIVIVGAYSGLRITSLLGLTWDDIDFNKGTVHVRAMASKSGRAYDAPMLGPARKVLERRKRKAGRNPLVFPGPQSGKRVHLTATYKAIKAAVATAGVSDFGHYNHASRHSFATWAVNRGVPLAVVSRWLGHASIEQTSRYAHHDPRESSRWADHFDSAVPASAGGAP